MKRITPEGSLLKAVTDLLTAERVWWMRCQTGAMVLGDGTANRRFYRSGKPGMADLLALPQCAAAHCSGCDDAECAYLAGVSHTAIWIELKSPSGRQSEAQKEFQREVEAAGHAYLLVRDVREVANFLKEAR